MDIFLTVLIIIASILLILVVLIQNPKGGGVSASFAGNANNMFGVQKTTDVLEKGTWGLIIAVVVFSISLNLFYTSDVDTSFDPTGSKVEERAKEEILPNQQGPAEEAFDDVAPAQ